MAGFDYSRSKATAERLIARFGQSGALRRQVSDNDPFNPTLTPTDYPCTFAVLDYDKKDVDGTLIKRTDQMVYLSTQGLAIVPETTDQLVVGGQPLTIIDAKPMSPAGLNLYFELQVRK